MNTKIPFRFIPSIHIAVFAVISIALIISRAIVLIFQINLVPEMEQR